MKKWESLPNDLKHDSVKQYYDNVSDKKCYLLGKRLFDILISLILSIVLLPVLMILCIVIIKDSRGGAFFLQERVTRYGRVFKIIKFRTMSVIQVKDSAQVTAMNDCRITKAGVWLRKYRLDELPQLFNILKGDMTFVGTRPEVPKYVSCYTDEMRATLLMRAGVTSKASICFKDEDSILAGKGDIDKAYAEEILPQKMRYNLEYLKECSAMMDIKLMLATLKAVVRKDTENG
ncbi:MAG: sugar transferase [Christensenellaceae bacterium]